MHAIVLNGSRTGDEADVWSRKSASSSNAIAEDADEEAEGGDIRIRSGEFVDTRPRTCPKDVLGSSTVPCTTKPRTSASARDTVSLSQDLTEV